MFRRIMHEDIFEMYVWNEIRKKILESNENNEIPSIV